MKNRETINNMAIFDLLKKIENYVNDNISPASMSDRVFCIQEVFDSRFTVTNEIGRKAHVCPYENHEYKGFITSHDCQNCLNSWLNEEVETTVSQVNPRCRKCGAKMNNSAEVYDNE